MQILRRVQSSLLLLIFIVFVIHSRHFVSCYHVATTLKNLKKFFEKEIVGLSTEIKLL